MSEFTRVEKGADLLKLIPAEMVAASGEYFRAGHGGEVRFDSEGLYFKGDSKGWVNGETCCVEIGKGFTFTPPLCMRIEIPHDPFSPVSYQAGLTGFDSAELGLDYCGVKIIKGSRHE